MNTRHKSFDPDKVIRDEIRAWHQREASVERLLEDCDKSARVHPLYGMGAILDLIKAGRRLYRRYLLSRFGYKAGRKDLYSAQRDHYVRPERAPSNAEEYSLFVTWFAEYAACECAFIMLMPELKKKISYPHEDFEAMYRSWRRQCRQALVQINGAIRVKLRLSKSYSDKRLDASLKREEEIIGISAWVASQISFEHNKRLEHSLKELNNSAFSGLLQELPATTFIEMANLVQEGVQPSVLANRVAKHLEKAGSQSAALQRRGKLATGDLPDESTGEPMLEQFLAKEELDAIIASAALTERECQVLELTGGGYLEREIASELGITEGSVKTLKHRGRGKLSAAAGP